ncbi:MAG: sugar ABC transporter permease [Kaistia sp. SCN 65-12]|nr:MAG: sugar ABC transporter permease [Kaistia sp. SCN 65-12]
MNIQKIDLAGRIITLLTLAVAIVWAFPLYWALVTTLKPEFEVVQPGLNLLPKTWTLEAYTHVLTTTKIGRWYVNSVVVSLVVTILVVLMGALCGYALSQLRFRGRTLLWFTVLASFMVPIQALIVTHFVLMSQFGLINSWLGLILPQLIVPVVVIVYKQFFDSVPKDFREAARVDGASEFDIFFRVYLPMNWGVTTALAIITFIGAWNNFLWPFLVSTAEDTMTITVGITQVKENFGVQYARNLAAAVLAAMPVAIVYLIFQRRVTQAIMLSAGIKG